MQGSLFDRRFVIVAGKGGVGKTTIAAALALAAARRGKRVLLAELGSKEKASRLLGHPQPVGYRVTRIRENLDLINVNPADALHEYGVMKLKFERVYRTVFENPVMKSLTRMIPGMNELTLIGKAWHLEQERDASGRPRWDMVVIDAPATGHGISLLGLPHVITEVVKAGPMYDETCQIRDMLTDRKRTVMNIVTLPEEMPVNETLELRDQMRDMLRIQPGYLFINRVWPPTHTSAELERLNRSWREAEAAHDASVLCLLTTTRFMARRRKSQDHYLKLLRERTDMARLEIPFLFQPTFGWDAIDTISQQIDASIP